VTDEPSERRFTPDEADAFLPELTDLLPKIRDARQTVFRAGEHIKSTATTNGGGTPGKEYWEAVGTLRRAIEHLAKEGIILRDAETGLVDFPSTRDGREVFLCWRLGEPRVGFWHGERGGFAGRRPL
jgi:hypothetical protein